MYSNGMTKDQWNALVSLRANAINHAINGGHALYEKFYKITYGLTDEQILNLSCFSGMTQADLDVMRACCNQKKQLYDAYRGISALTLFDYHSTDVPFQE